MRITTAGIARKHDRYLVALRRPGTSIGESWEFPGGKHRSSESPEETLRREFYEELGVDVLIGRCLFTTSFYNGMKEYELRAYDVTLQSEQFQLGEHQDIGWFTIEEILSLPTAGSDRAVAEFLALSK